MKMGRIRTALLSFTDDELADAREHVRTLFQLGESRAQFFEKDITQNLKTAGIDVNDKLSIPISSILDTHSTVHAYHSSINNRVVAETFKSALGEFVKGGASNIIEGMSHLLAENLETLLHDTNATTAERSKFILMVDGQSIVRIDIRMWYTDTTTSRIQKAIDKIVVVTAVKSLVDVAQLETNTLVHVYQHQLNRVVRSSADIQSEIEKIVALANKLKHN